MLISGKTGHLVDLSAYVDPRYPLLHEGRSHPRGNPADRLGARDRRNGRFPALADGRDRFRFDRRGGRLRVHGLLGNRGIGDLRKD